MSRHHDESKLPMWAQRLIGNLRTEASILKSELKRTRNAHAVLTGREWFALNGPTHDGGPDVYKLWYFERNDPRPLCSLRKGDVLVVGRGRNDSPVDEAGPSRDGE